MRAMLLALALAALALSLPLDPFRVRLPFKYTHQYARPLPAPRRAPLAEHGWEERVLRNLTRSD